MPRWQRRLQLWRTGRWLTNPRICKVDPFGKTRQFDKMKRDVRTVRMLASMLIGAMQRLDFQPAPEEGLPDGLEMGRTGIKCKY